MSSAESVTRAKGSSFYFAAIALSRAEREAAFELYAFFRRLDDSFDEAQDAQSDVLANARDVVAWLFAAHDSPPPQGVWPENELRALLVVVCRYRLPRQPFDDMIAGMQMDAEGVRYVSERELEVYCDRVAGTVGVLMATLLGTSAPLALRAAEALGRAMQLTNILRDIGEDWRRGRVYIPSQALAAAQVDARVLPTLGRDPRFGALMQQRIAEARALYQQAYLGVAWLDSVGRRWLVLMMLAIYSDILRVIETQHYDVFAQRARVSFWRKVRLAVSALWHAWRMPIRLRRGQVAAWLQ